MFSQAPRSVISNVVLHFQVDYGKTWTSRRGRETSPSLGSEIKRCLCFQNRTKDKISQISYSQKIYCNSRIRIYH